MRSFCISILCVCLALTAFGQGDRGTITGRVTDPAGAVVANAPLQLINTGTGALYTAATSATGNYTFSQLPVGNYTMTVEVPGFKSYTRQNLGVQVAITLRVDVQLEVGTASESVTVTAEASMLRTETAELSTNVTTTRLNNLPILGVGSQTASSHGVRNPLAASAPAGREFHSQPDHARQWHAFEHLRDPRGRPGRHQRRGQLRPGRDAAFGGRY